MLRCVVGCVNVYRNRDKKFSGSYDAHWAHIEKIENIFRLIRGAKKGRKHIIFFYKQRAKSEVE